MLHRRHLTVSLSPAQVTLNCCCWCLPGRPTAALRPAGRHQAATLAVWGSTAGQSLLQTAWHGLTGKDAVAGQILQSLVSARKSVTSKPRNMWHYELVLQQQQQMVYCSRGPSQLLSIKPLLRWATPTMFVTYGSGQYPQIRKHVNQQLPAAGPMHHQSENMQCPHCYSLSLCDMATC